MSKRFVTIFNDHVVLYVSLSKYSFERQFRPITSVMIVLDNIIFKLQTSGGISVVWYELIKGLLNRNLEFRCIEFVDTNNINRDRLSIPDNLILCRNPKLWRLKRYFNLRVDGMCDKFIFHSSYYRICSSKNAANVTTVHDFTYEYYCSGIKKWIHCRQKYNAIRKSDYIICISENTKKDLLKFLPDVAQKPIEVIYNGVSDDYYRIADREELSLPFAYNSYLLYVGSRDRYKNFRLSVEIAAATGLNLVVVGAPLRKDEFVLLNTLLGKDYYTVLNGLTNQRLNMVYNGAKALLYLSVYEGFGIPVLEAQKAGCPVVAYKMSSIPEIIGNTPLLINSLSIGQVVALIHKLDDAAYRDEIVSEGLKNASKYTWDRMSNRILDIYREILNKQ